MPQARLETAISTSERLKTVLASDRSAIETGIKGTDFRNLRQNFRSQLKMKYGGRGRNKEITNRRREMRVSEIEDTHWAEKILSEAYCGRERRATRNFAPD
jgi:hypothetical protein